MTTTTAAPARVTLQSFGYLHRPAPAADFTVDVRRSLHDPAAAAAKGILDLDGRDPRVQQLLLGTLGAVATIVNIVAFVVGSPRDRACVVVVGCAGGRHRSVVIVVLAAAILTLL